MSENQPRSLGDLNLSIEDLEKLTSNMKIFEDGSLHSSLTALIAALNSTRLSEGLIKKIKNRTVNPNQIALINSVVSLD
jgi:hypothetical protein